MANIHSQEKRILRAERERNENRRYTSAIKTSSSTWAGLTSSLSIVSCSTGKLGGAVRMTSELVAWSGTMVVCPTSPDGAPDGSVAGVGAAGGGVRLGIGV